MSRVRPHRNKCLRALNALLLAASAAGVFAAFAAHAQESSTLRGAVTERDDQFLGPAAPDRARERPSDHRRDRAGRAVDPAPAYQPASPGAVPEDQAASAAAGSSLFEDPAAEASPFEGPPLPTRAADVDGAAERVEEGRRAQAAGERPKPSRKTPT